MRETLELGSSPCNEDCVNVSKTADYMSAMREECKRYKALLEKLFPVPEGVKAWFGIKSYPHDFGSYLEVVVYFDDEDVESAEFAYNVEGNLPENWEVGEVGA